MVIKKEKRRRTTTSAFGTSGREGHDSSPFYDRRMYDILPKEKKTRHEENPIPDNLINTIIQGSAENMKALPNNSVHLMITSPPYNVGKEYDADYSLSDYLEFLKTVWKEVKRVLVPGGRACINIANVGRKPYVPLHTWIIQDLISLGFLMRGEIIWDKSASSGTSTAWGSWKSASNPTLRDTHEYILIFSKDSYKRKKSTKKINTIRKEDFLELTKSIWRFPTVSAKKIGHPAPFPEELPRRLIELYSFQDDIILDPFIGSGQTAIAALETKRRFIGYEINEDYVNLSEERIREYRVRVLSPKLTDFMKEK